MKNHIRILALLLSVIVSTYIPTTSASIVTGLLGHYEFEGDATDSSGNGNNGLVFGSLTYETGPVGQAARFDGLSYITLDTLLFPLMVGTTSLWAVVDTEASGTTLSAIDSKTNFRSAFEFGPPNPSSELIIGNSDITTPYVRGVWTHYVYTYENGNRNLFVNNVLVDSATGPSNNGDISSFYGSLPGKTSIGNGIHDSSCFDGALDDVRIYDRALNISEISQLYGMGTVFLNSGSGSSTQYCKAVNTSVPEPATLALLGLSLAVIGFSKRKAGYN